MTVIEKFMPVGHPNRPGTKLEQLSGIIVHYTANTNHGANAAANAGYFSRGFFKDSDGVFWEKTAELKKTKFSRASTQVVIDDKQAVICIPLGEAAYGAGDRPLPYTDQLKGQKPAALQVFANRQNYRAVQIEICNNSDGNWQIAVDNAARFIVDFAKGAGRTIDFEASAAAAPSKNGGLVILRHFDVTGKVCPKPFVDNPAEWTRFLARVKLLTA